MQGVFFTGGESNWSHAMERMQRPISCQRPMPADLELQSWALHSCPPREWLTGHPASSRQPSRLGQPHACGSYALGEAGSWRDAARLSVI